MTGLFVTLSIAIILMFDLLYFGFLFSLDPEYQKFQGYDENEYIVFEEKNVTGQIRSSFLFKIFSDSNYGGLYKVILTNKRLLVKPHFLTCNLALDIENIASAKRENPIFNQDNISINYLNPKDSENRVLNFQSKNIGS